MTHRNVSESKVLGCMWFQESLPFRPAWNKQFGNHPRTCIYHRSSASFIIGNADGVATGLWTRQVGVTERSRITHRICTSKLSYWTRVPNKADPPKPRIYIFCDKEPLCKNPRSKVFENPYHDLCGRIGGGATEGRCPGSSNRSECGVFEG